MEHNLLCTPAEMVAHEPLERTACDFSNKNTVFRVETRKYSQQYAQIYNARMKGIRERLEQTAEKKWGIKPLVEIASIIEGERCCIVGNIFKDMRLKPSVLRELSEDHHLIPLPPRKKYTEQEDYLILEDHSLRLTLITDQTDTDTLVTGVPVVIVGCQENRGRFKVEELAYASILGPELSIPIPDDKYLLLVSGLNVGGANTDMLSLELLIDHLTGCGGGIQDSEIMSKVCHVIIAGNLIADKYVRIGKDRNQTVSTLESVSTADSYLSRMVTSLQVTLMPGTNEPGNITLPQQPLYEPMFPKSISYSTLNMVTNPNSMSIDGRTLLGTSGQNIDNIYKFCTTEDRMAILESTLKWGHMAPTAPETLSCYPYDHSHLEPFIIQQLPNIYFAGNQPEFKFKYYEPEGESTLLILVPDFSIVNTCVLVNLKNLECHSMSFATQLNSNGDDNNNPIPMEM
ncbi:DNA polymerase delta subunit 2 [Oopsacas minuta]|uniref:DNA polymerase delta subunit 2 n=1 Tax=Oopsacas minuta TaxID=111878 RepID=A0AAV7JXJ5_9METZ|nr:DNA polymerase delta subunit 2 [Oopsacas minuta]